MSKSLLPINSGRARALAGLLFLVPFLFATQAAHAAFPGLNGKISFDRYDAPFTLNADRTASNERRPQGRLKVAVTDQIFTMNPDGTSQANVSNNDLLNENSGWNAAGSQLTYDSWVFFANQNQVWKMNGDGSAQTDLTNNTDNSDGHPAWSPDGTRVVYTHFNPDNEYNELWVMNADGSNPHQLFTPTDGASDDEANWSPDGTKIAFAQVQIVGNQLVSQIYIVNADGSGTPQNVSNDSDWDEDPNWSPDGTKLAFDKFPDNEGLPEIWVMNADGSSPHEVAGDAQSQDEAPAFSPDGTQIAYQHGDVEVIKGFPTTGQEIWVVSADGTNDHQVSTPSDGLRDYVPDWQPVGSPASSATFPTGCTATASVVVHAADASHFISPLNVHYKVDGGAEQVAAADGAGNVTIPVGNGTHTVEYWGGDAAGYQEAAHHTGTVTIDTVHQCAPQVGVAGVRRACVSKAFSIRVHISSVGAPKSVKVFLGKKRVLSTTKTSFTLKINPKKLARRTKLRIVTTGSTGKVTTITRTIARCAVAKPHRHAAPRFTG